MLRECFHDDIAKFLSQDEWLVAEHTYDPAANPDNEARFGLVNGRMGNRASHEEGDARTTLPANYVHGLFDRSEAFMRELCNTPNWNLLKLNVLGCPIGPESGELSGYLRVLDLKNGILAKRYEMTDREGRRTRVESLKCLSRAQPRCAMLIQMITPLNYNAPLYIENQINASVNNFDDMPRFRVRHLETVKVSPLGIDGCYVESRTRDFGMPVGTGARVRMYLDGKPVAPAHPHFRAFGEVGCEFLDIKLGQGETLRLEKFAAVTTGRDCHGVEAQVRKELEQLMNLGADEALAMHCRNLHQLWDRADLVIQGDNKLQKAMRFNLYHLMNTPDPSDDTVSVGAKLLHGEEYGGHAYWDTELFVMPFFCFVFPNIARNLAGYRGHLLAQARRDAAALGWLGAKYPWESADTGEEECPAWTIGYDGDLSRCLIADYEHHVTSAVAYGLNRYTEITGDVTFMQETGLEILLETARFWASRMTWNDEKKHYEILQVTGPDEWHEPVDNNAYTNHLARWNILQAVRLLNICRVENPELYCRLKMKTELDENELEYWQSRAEGLFLQAREGLIEQFDGYFSLDEAVVTRWDENNMPIMPDNPKDLPVGQRKILKQADVVMLMFLLPEQFSLETQRENYLYYEQRTRHGSSLSPSIHCIMGLRVGDTRRAYQYLERSAYVDLDNNQRNLREGIHAASAGGTWQCVTLGYCGMEVTAAGDLRFNPRLPDHWSSVSFSIVYKGDMQRIRVENGDVDIISANRPVSYLVSGREKTSRVDKI